MAKLKFDGVVEAAHYQPDGQLAWVRVYLRRGPTFTDRLKLERSTLIEHLKAGKHFYAGKRLELLASTFEISTPVHVLQRNGQEVLVTGEIQADRDRLEGIPMI
jgi:hypothetical protein